MIISHLVRKNTNPNLAIREYGDSATLLRHQPIVHLTFVYTRHPRCGWLKNWRCAFCEDTRTGLKMWGFVGVQVNEVCIESDLIFTS